MVHRERGLWPKTLFVATVLLGIIGVVVLFSAGDGWMPWALPQLGRFGIGLILMAAVFAVRLEWVYKIAYVAYGISLLLLVAVHVVGLHKLGAQRWLGIGSFAFQPSEFMKLAIILFLARYFYDVRNRLDEIGVYIIPLLAIAMPFALIFSEPDFGTAIMLGVIGIVMVFMAGIGGWYLVSGFLTVVILTPVAWLTLLKDYQKTRILTFLGLSQDPLGAGYHVTQSKISVGSGGFLGLGFMQGTQTQLNFLPEKETDFAFTLFAENFGFVGSMILLALYATLIFKGTSIAAHSKTVFSRLTAIGISILLTLYFFVNTGMTLGLLPVVGVPLPIISYGGTVMLTAMIALGLLANLERNLSRDFRAY